MDISNHLFSKLSTKLLRVFFVISIFVMTSCSGNPFIELEQPSPTQVIPKPDTDIDPAPLAEVFFEVSVPDGTDPDAEISILITDELTGIALNQTRYQMQPKGDHRYLTKLPLPLGSMVKYRYLREGNTASDEFMPVGNPVRYRLAHISGPGLYFNDIVSAWSDLPFSGDTGRIAGNVTDLSTRTGIPNVLVAAGGVSTITSSDGSYLLNYLSPGIHNLVVYSLDGAFATFQQGAIVAPKSTTPAPIGLLPGRLVNVTFLVSAPDEKIVNLPIRLAGNFYQTGNTFGELNGGMSAIASRMPLLTQLPDGRYSLTIGLPVGADFRYKYSLGDGFWNAEHTTSGEFRIRQLIVPDRDIVIQDTISSWRSGDLSPIMFEVTVPDYTPPEDYISIQLNPFDWTEPLPMWSLGNNKWLYVLFSPLQNMDQVSYRFCRNDQCGDTDNSNTAVSFGTESVFTPGEQIQTKSHIISAWNWLQPKTEPTTVISAAINGRSDSFSAGVELQSNYHPSWQTRYPSTFQKLWNTGSRWVIIPATWTYLYGTNPIIEPVPGIDPLWSDLHNMVDQADYWGLKVAIFPTPRFEDSSETWWTTAPKDLIWWEEWFDRYKTFLIHHADLATRVNADALILGGDWLSPALPEGMLSDGVSSEVPTDAENRWREIITEVRSRYQGKLIWAVDFRQVQLPPPFLDTVDEIYLLWSVPIADGPDPSEYQLEIEISHLMDQIVKPFQDTIGKPITLGIAYPSTNGSAQGCIPSPEGSCIQWHQLNRPNPDIPSVDINLQEQLDIYNAFFAVVNQRDWISGFFSRGFYPPAALQDKSASIHGKPAADVIWYWFQNISSNQVQ
jgi:hypothetical protein